jgi:nitroreductase
MMPVSRRRIEMIYDLVVKNRSYRGYDSHAPIDRKLLESFVECARLCPSSVNVQPLKYFIACDKEITAMIQKDTRWAKGLPELTLPHPGKEPTAFIVICQDTQIDPNLNRFSRDVGIVAQTMLLSAVENGLGGCMIGNFLAKSLSVSLGLPDHIHPLLVVAFGKPDETVRLTDVKDDGSTAYYRDEQDVHYVPKRALKDLLLN